MILLIITIFLVPINLELQNIIWMISLFVLSMSLVFLSGIHVLVRFTRFKSNCIFNDLYILIQLFTIQPATETPLMNTPMTLSIISIPILILLTVLYHYLKPKIKIGVQHGFFPMSSLIFVVQWLVMVIFLQ